MFYTYFQLYSQAQLDGKMDGNYLKGQQQSGKETKLKYIPNHKYIIHQHQKLFND